jgi:hypothetical protein
LSKTFEERIQDWQQLVERIKKTPMPGLIPSPPDPRDYTIEDIPMMAAQVPDKYHLKPSPIILNQGQTPYCGGASGAGMANAYYNTFGIMPNKGFSMTFIYWLAKQYDGIPEINGTYIRTVLKIMQKYGCAPEALAPFSFTRTAITPTAIREAEEFKIQAYARLHTVQDIQLAYLRGMYVIMGTLVTRDNWNRPDGFLSYPRGQLYGGHATHSFGYDSLLKRDHLGYCFNQNSWGEQWGHNGRFYLPFDYFRMTYEGKPVFLEAWAVKFPPVETVQPKPEPIEPKPKIEPKKKKQFPLHWKRRGRGMLK